MLPPEILNLGLSLLYTPPPSRGSNLMGELIKNKSWWLET